jgi:phage terminase large subunit-like protein
MTATAVATLDLAAVDQRAAGRALDFVRALRHTKGQYAGSLFRLQPWQAEVVAAILGTLRADGRRTYRTAYLEVPRKNGKTELAAAIALYLLLCDNEPGAEVYSAAADREQASLVFAAARQMVATAPALLKRCKIIDSQKRIIVPATNSVYRAISAEAYSKHGFNASAVIYDELHAAPNRDLWDVLATSMGARTQPLMLAITTAGYDRNSICWELHSYAERVREGSVTDPSFYGRIYGAPADADWSLPETWRACNPNLGVSVSEDFLASECARAQAVPAYQNTFRRLYLNQWTTQDERWLDMAAWDASAGVPDVASLSGRECYAGLDLASTTDVAALVLVFPPRDDGAPYDVLTRFWIPGDSLRARCQRDRVPYDEWARLGLVTVTEGNVIDYRAIREEIVRLGQQYDIREIAFDRWGAAQVSVELAGEGFTMVAFGQGFASMSAPTKELLKLVLSRRLWHGGNPVLRWMADNLRVRQDPAGNLKPDKERSTEKIDGMVALIMALDRASRNAAAGAPGISFA